MRNSLRFFVAKQSLHLVVSNRTYLYLISFEKWWHFSNSSRKSSLILPDEGTHHYQIRVLLIFEYWRKPSHPFPKLRSTRGRWMCVCVCVCVFLQLLSVWRASVITEGSLGTESCMTSSFSAAPWRACSYAWLLLLSRFGPAFLACHSSFLSCILGESLPYLSLKLYGVKLWVSFSVISDSPIAWVYL